MDNNKLGREKILAIDPSGNFEEGKGTTGWFLGDELGNQLDFGQIYAKDYKAQIAYWKGIIQKIYEIKPDIIVCEDYRLYASAANAQINSHLETPQLIGVIKWYCYKHQRRLHMQLASEVKQRWADDIIKKDLPHHTKDAYRHYIHFITFKLHKTYKMKNKRTGEYENYDRPREKV